MATKKSKTPPRAIGEYDLLRKVGEGGMGTVYQARHQQTQEIVAVKIMAEHVAYDTTLLKRFEQEFRGAGKLDHPNVIRVVEFSNQGKSPYLVMEFVEGETLADKLDRDGRMPEEEAVRIITQVCHGLHWAHCLGLIHRDIKPDNIMVTPEGVAKIMDLGLAKDLDATGDLTRAGAGLGTPNYMAPEQFSNAKNVDIRCDVYSLGATLYEMVTGIIPFEARDALKILKLKMSNDLPNPRTVVPDLSDRADKAIRRALSVSPENRPGSCLEFVEELLSPLSAAARTENPDQPDQWYLSYADMDGSQQMLVGDVATLCEALEEGKVANVASIRLSRSKRGPFRALEWFDEFRNVKLPSTESAESGARTQAAPEQMPSAQQRPAPAATGIAARGRRPSLLPNDKQSLEPGGSLLQESKPGKPTEAGGERSNLLLVLLTMALAMAGGLYLFMGK